jgi:hypothetical protein
MKLNISGLVLNSKNIKDTNEHFKGGISYYGMYDNPGLYGAISRPKAQGSDGFKAKGEHLFTIPLIIDLINNKETTSLNAEQTIANFINSTQRSMVNIITQSIINITHDIVQQQIATISSNADLKNNIDASRIIVRNGAVFSIEQQNNLKQTVQAILNLIQSSTLVAKLSSLIKNDINATLSQSADLANKVAATSALLKATKSSGEINNAINGVKDVLKSVADMGTVREDNTTLLNNIVNVINLDSSSRADIDDYVSTMINTTIEQTTINTCVQSSTALNEITLNKILVEGPETSFEIVQENILVALYKCVISSTLKSEDLQNLSTEILNRANLNQTQGANISSDLSAEKTKSDITDSTSLLDSIGGIIVVVIIIIIIGVTMLFMK